METFLSTLHQSLLSARKKETDFHKEADMSDVASSATIPTGILGIREAADDDIFLRGVAFFFTIIPMVHQLILISLVPVFLGVVAQYQSRIAAQAQKLIAKHVLGDQEK